MAKRAGHVSAVAPGHYTQAVRRAESAVAALERAFTVTPGAHRIRLMSS